MKSLNVLVVDGSAVFRDVVRDILEKAGCTVTIENTGAAGLESAQLQDFTLICTGYHLPDMAGVDFCSQIRGLPEYKHTSLILLTAEDNTVTLKRAMLAGATDIFNKQDLDQLETYIQRLVKRETRTITGRVLFVEDSVSVQGVFLDILIDMGLDVDAYTRAEDAWVAYQRGGYDLVMTDIILEGAMSGVTLVRKIRRLDGDDGDVPVIAISGFDNVSRRIELFHLGINDYVAKPIIQEELIERVYNQIHGYHIKLELRSQQQSLNRMAMLDESTQLFNRYSLREFSGRYFSDVDRNNSPLSLAVLEVDDFQQIEKESGSDKSLAVIAELGIWLKRIVREADMVARWKGEKFVFLLANCEKEAAMDLMLRVSSRLKRLKPADTLISASIGIATMSVGEKHDLASLFSLADTALIQAKEAGQDQVSTCEVESEEA
ncbi:MAG: response regulator [Methylophaga sp.]|nr:response regulator [Methylophaga sp.]